MIFHAAVLIVRAPGYPAPVPDSRSRGRWLLALAGIVALGILSRVVHTGIRIFDKYLGDALYAAMVYAILRLFWKSSTAAIRAAVAMTTIELFQLTLIPAHMVTSHSWITRICGRLMGTEFSVLDLAAYGVGIGCIWLADAPLFGFRKVR